MGLTNFVSAIVALLLPTKSVDGFVSILTTIAQRLAAAEAAQSARASSLIAQAQMLHEEAAAASAEAGRAARVRANLGKLID